MGITDAENYEITLRGKDGASLPARVVLMERGNESHLVLEFLDERHAATASDFFDAFANVRRALWSRGILPVCYGASRNVFPSGMSRDMGGGVKAYRIFLGQPAKMKDLVFIFDNGLDVEPVSPEEQEQFFEQWTSSLGRRC